MSDYWHPFGLSFAGGMAVHLMDKPKVWWSAPARGEQADQERRLPNNQFTQNAREADELMLLHRFARATPCHDRPEHFARMAGAYGRPVGAYVWPREMQVMEGGIAR
jgi:hypothetical protein